jgi:hypothetical protein
VKKTTNKSENRTKRQSRAAKTALPKNTEAVVTTEATPEVKEEVATEAVPEVKVEEPKAETKTETKAAKKEPKAPRAARGTKTAAKKEKEEKPATTRRAKSSEVITLQVDGRDDLSMNTLVDRVKAAYVAEGHKASSIKNVEVYVKLSENMAYYVIDGYASGISLF